MRSPHEIRFSNLWLNHFPDIDLHTEYRFLPDRKFRFDFACLATKTAIEIQGGIWIQGRHARGKALLTEYEKINLANENGWTMFFLADEMITNEWIFRIGEHILTQKSKMKRQNSVEALSF